MSSESEPVNTPQVWEYGNLTWEQRERMKQRAQAGLAYGRGTTLKTQRDYYLRQAEDPDNSPADRRLWKALAEEVTKRLNDGPGAGDQQQLPFA